MKTASWRTQWVALAARIEGLIRAGELFYRTLANRNADDYGVAKKVLVPESAEMYSLIESYRNLHAAVLPSSATACATSFLDQFKDHFAQKEVKGDLDRQLPFIQLRLTALANFQSKFDYLTRDTEYEILRATERAFQHLQRCIVADARYRTTWCEAYTSGEVACERLGAVHLLWHGIWAFKVDAAGERTDLVMGNRIDTIEEVEDSAVGLVLTEWKRATSTADAAALLKQAKTQAALYSKGSLSGVELSSTRYIVVVTEHKVDMPAPETEAAVDYRYVNVAVDPETPSKAAK